MIKELFTELIDFTICTKVIQVFSMNISMKNRELSFCDDPYAYRW